MQPEANPIINPQDDVPAEPPATIPTSLTTEMVHYHDCYVCKARCYHADDECGAICTVGQPWTCPDCETTN